MKPEHFPLVSKWIEEKNQSEFTRYFQNSAGTLDKKQFLALFKLALQFKFTEAIDYFSSSSLLTELEPDELKSLLKSAVIHADLENFSKLLPKKENERDALDLSALVSQACSEGHLNIVQYLLTTDPTLLESCFGIALLKATQAKKMAIIEYLLLNGDEYNGNGDIKDGKLVGYALKIERAIQQIPDQETAQLFIATLNRIDSKRYQKHIKHIAKLFKTSPPKPGKGKKKSKAYSKKTEKSADTPSSPSMSSPTTQPPSPVAATLSISTVEMTPESPSSNGFTNSASCSTSSSSTHMQISSLTAPLSITDQILGQWNDALGRKDKAKIHHLLEKNQGVLTPNRIKNTFESLATEENLDCIRLLLSLEQESNSGTHCITGQTRQLCIGAALRTAQRINQRPIIEHLLNLLSQEKYEPQTAEVLLSILLQAIRKLDKRLALLILEKITFTETELTKARTKLRDEHKTMGSSPTSVFTAINAALSSSIEKIQAPANESTSRQLNSPADSFTYSASLPTSFYFSTYLAASNTSMTRSRPSTPAHAFTDCPAIREPGDDEDADKTENDVCSEDKVFEEEEDDKGEQFELSSPMAMPG